MNKFNCTARLLTLACCIFGLTSNAQTKRFSFGPYAELAVPDGNFHQTNKVGYGIGLNADVKVIAGFSLTLSGGYERFEAQPQVNVVSFPPLPNAFMVAMRNPTIIAIPLKAGVQYDLSSLFYVKAEAGCVSLHGKEFDKTKPVVPPGYTESGTSFLYAPGVGVHISHFDASLRYEHWATNHGTGFWGIKTAYRFKI